MTLEEYNNKVEEARMEIAYDYKVALNRWKVGEEPSAKCVRFIFNRSTDIDFTPGNSISEMRSVLAEVDSKVNEINAQPLKTVLGEPSFEAYSYDDEEDVESYITIRYKEFMPPTSIDAVVKERQHTILNTVVEGEIGRRAYISAIKRNEYIAGDITWEALIVYLNARHIG